METYWPNLEKYLNGKEEHEGPPPFPHCLVCREDLELSQLNSGESLDLEPESAEPAQKDAGPSKEVLLMPCGHIICSQCRENYPADRYQPWKCPCCRKTVKLPRCDHAIEPLNLSRLSLSDLLSLPNSIPRSCREHELEWAVKRLETKYSYPSSLGKSFASFRLWLDAYHFDGEKFEPFTPSRWSMPIRWTLAELQPLVHFVVDWIDACVLAFWYPMAASVAVVKVYEAQADKLRPNSNTHWCETGACYECQPTLLFEDMRKRLWVSVVSFSLHACRGIRWRYLVWVFALTRFDFVRRLLHSAFECLLDHMNCVRRYQQESCVHCQKYSWFDMVTALVVLSLTLWPWAIMALFYLHYLAGPPAIGRVTGVRKVVISVEYAICRFIYYLKKQKLRY